MFPIAAIPCIIIAISYMILNYARFGSILEFSHKIILFGVPCLILLHFIVTCCHRTLGGWLFGQCYTVNAIPALMLAIAYIFPDKNKYVKLSEMLLLVGMRLKTVGYILLIIKAL